MSWFGFGGSDDNSSSSSSSSSSVYDTTSFLGDDSTRAYSSASTTPSGNPPTEIPVIVPASESNTIAICYPSNVVILASNAVFFAESSCTALTNGITNIS